MDEARQESFGGGPSGILAVVSGAAMQWAKVAGAGSMVRTTAGAVSVAGGCEVRVVIDAENGGAACKLHDDFSPAHPFAAFCIGQLVFDRQQQERAGRTTVVAADASSIARTTRTAAQRMGMEGW